MALFWKAKRNFTEPGAVKETNDFLAAAKDAVNEAATAILALQGGVPGLISLFAGSAAPTGHLLCDGSAVSRTTYAGLFAVIGTTYGSGDGSTTFNVPNLKGRVPVGKDASQTEFDTLGETGGANTVTLTSAQSGLKAHVHELNIVPNNTGGAKTGGVLSYSGTTTASSAYQANNNSASNAAEAHTNLQPYIVLNYIIKT